MDVVIFFSVVIASIGISYAFAWYLNDYRLRPRPMTNTEVESGLLAARRALIDCGFCGTGGHGTGDQEVNAIEAALRAFRIDRRLKRLADLGFVDAAEFASDYSGKWKHPTVSGHG